MDKAGNIEPFDFLYNESLFSADTPNFFRLEVISVFDHRELKRMNGEMIQVGFFNFREFFRLFE